MEYLYEELECNMHFYARTIKYYFYIFIRSDLQKFIGFIFVYILTKFLVK